MNIYDYAEILWNYHHLNQEIVKSECIIAFGSHDLNVAERAAELYLSGNSDFIIMTGGLGRVTEKIWHEPEAIKYREVALLKGVPADRILTEDKSKNTGENISFVKQLLDERNISISNAIVVDKPYKERRLYATLRKQWPDLNIIVTSPQFSFDDYLKYYSESKEVKVDDFINIMVGDIQRIDLYGKNGFQIPLEIPDNVWIAYNELVSAGYDKQLINTKPR